MRYPPARSTPAISLVRGKPRKSHRIHITTLAHDKTLKIQVQPLAVQETLNDPECRGRRNNVRPTSGYRSQRQGVESMIGAASVCFELSSV
jgi:hypothetical protein